MSDTLAASQTPGARVLPIWELQAQTSGFRASALFTQAGPAGDEEGGLDEAGDGVVEDALAIDEPTGPSLEDQIAEAYARGFADGEAEGSTARAADTAATSALAGALALLKPQLSDTLCRFMLESLRTLLERTSGFREPDAALLQRHCEALAALVTREMSGARLLAHPADLKLLDGAPCGLALAADETLKRGTLCLAHDDGWIEQGTQPLLDELQSLIDTLEAGQ